MPLLLAAQAVSQAANVNHRSVFPMASRAGKEATSKSPIDPKITALPMTMSGQNMKRLINCRACSHRVVEKLECKDGEEQYRQNGEQNPLRIGLGKSP